MSTAEEKLLKLAAVQFPKPTAAEEKLLRAAPVGNIARCDGPTAALSDLQNSRPWDKAYTIRAEVIHWLCVDREAITLVSPKGIHIEAAEIKGRLELESVVIPFSLVL